MYKHLVSAALGAATATALFMSCSDNSVPTVDAQTGCDCPAAEPPLAGRVIRETNTKDIEPESTAIQGVGCPTGATLLGGGCGQDNDSVTTSINGPDADTEGWVCSWRNPSTQASTGSVTAICLVPPEE